MSFKKEALMSELGLMMEKEREMKTLYDEMLKKLSNTFIRKKIEFIRDDEIKHMGYVRIMISLFEDENP